MSYDLHPFAVDLARVERAFGCRDEALLKQVTLRVDISLEGGREDPDDDSDEYWDEDWDEEDSHNNDVDEAVCDIIAGRPFRDGLAQSYADALVRLLKHFGRALPRYFIYGSTAISVDTALVRAGTPPEAFSMVDHLMYRGAPVPIPDPDDFPYFGYLRAHEMGPALRAIRAAELAEVHADDRGAVAELRGWLEACSAEGRDLVCYYT